MASICHLFTDDFVGSKVVVIPVWLVACSRFGVPSCCQCRFCLEMWTAKLLYPCLLDVVCWVVRKYFETLLLIFSVTMLPCRRRNATCRDELPRNDKSWMNSLYRYDDYLMMTASRIFMVMVQVHCRLYRQSLRSEDRKLLFIYIKYKMCNRYIVPGTTWKRNSTFL